MPEITPPSDHFTNIILPYMKMIVAEIATLPDKQFTSEKELVSRLYEILEVIEFSTIIDPDCDDDDEEKARAFFPWYAVVDDLLAVIEDLKYAIDNEGGIDSTIEAFQLGLIDKAEDKGDFVKASSINRYISTKTKENYKIWNEFKEQGLLRYLRSQINHYRSVYLKEYESPDNHRLYEQLSQSLLGIIERVIQNTAST